MCDSGGIPTPAALIDLQKMLTNANTLADRLNAQGLPLRLHVKTCKSADAALMCMGGAYGPITVASLEEAEYFGNAGFTDMIYAVGISRNKVPGLRELIGKGYSIKIILDSPEMAEQIAASGLPLEVLIEIDCDGHRGGIAPESSRLLTTAKILAKAGFHICGVLTHAGSAYELPCPSPKAYRELARREARAALKAAAILQKSGFTSEIISIGSTPTARYGQDFQGVTEVRAGTHVFMDCVMAALGVCEQNEMALSVLATVIGRKVDGGIVIDAGWTALSSDRGVDFAKYGYGLVGDENGKLLPELTVRQLNQEHGILGTSSRFMPDLPIGSQVRIYPVHACATAHCFSKYYVCTSDKNVVIWEKCPTR